MEISLGKISVATPGVPVRLTSNLEDPAKPLYVHAYAILRLEGDAGNIYVQTDSEDHRDTLSNVLSILTSKNPAFSAGVTMEVNGSNLSRIWINADYAGDGVLAAALIS